MKVQRIRIGLALAVCTVTLACCRVAAQPITSDMRLEDTRLEKTLTIAEKEIRLGELLDRVAKMTGVQTRLDPDDAGADATILISVTQMRLGDLMNDLWSLSSFRKAEWKWTRSGDAGTYNYKLMRPGPAHDLPNKLRSKIQTDYESNVDALKRASKMTEAQRAKLPRGNPGVDPGLDDPRTMAALAIYSDGLNAADQADVLHEGGRKQVSTAGLSNAEQQFIIRWSNGVLPPYVVFSSQRNNDDLTPSLFMQMPNPDGTEGGYNYAGGVPLGMAEGGSLAAMWLLPDDSAYSDLEEQKISGVKDRSGEFTFRHMSNESLKALQDLPEAKRLQTLRSAQLALETELFDLSQGASIPVLAILPTSQSSGQLANGNTVSQYLHRVNPSFRPQVMVKWRSGALLLCSPSWFYHAPERMAWSTVTELRHIVDEGLPLSRLLRALERVTREQMTAAADEFPFFSALLPAQNLFALYYNYPQILADEGLKVSADNIEAIRLALNTAIAPPTPVSGIDWRRQMTLYVTEKETSDGATATKNILFELDYADGTTAWYKPVRIRYSARPPVASIKQ